MGPSGPGGPGAGGGGGGSAGGSGGSGGGGGGEQHTAVQAGAQAPGHPGGQGFGLRLETSPTQDKRKFHAVSMMDFKKYTKVYNKVE